MRNKEKFIKAKSDRTETISARVTPQVKKAFDDFALKNDMSKSSCLAWIVYNAIYDADLEKDDDLLERVLGVTKELTMLIQDDELIKSIANRNGLDYRPVGKFIVKY